MGTLTKGYTFGATEEVTAAKLHLLIDSGTVTGIVGADINDGVITDAKITGLSGSKLTGLANTPAGAGVIPAANLTSVAQKGANSDITSLSGLTTLLSRAQGGLASNVANNAANGVVFLDANSKLPAVDGSQLTGLSTVTQVNDVETTGVQLATNTTILSVAKTITSGKTVLLMASGYVYAIDGVSSATLYLKNDSTTAQTVITGDVNQDTGQDNVGWTMCAIVTGLSGSVTFSVTGTESGGSNNDIGVRGNLVVIEF